VAVRRNAAIMLLFAIAGALMTASRPMLESMVDCRVEGLQLKNSRRGVKVLEF
jgi:hypothetical protein